MSGAKNRANQTRTLARRMTTDYGVTVEADYDPSRRWWSFIWTDGPTEETLMKALTAAGYQFVHPTTRQEVERRQSFTALGLTAIRMAEAGASFGRHNIYNVQSQHRATEYPERCTAREAAMVARLKTAATTEPDQWGNTWLDDTRMVDLVAERGIGWLLENEPTEEGQPGVDLTDRSAVLALLTAHYAIGQQADDWRRRGRPLTLRDAVYAATADPGLVDPELTLALLTLVPDFLQELKDEALRIKKRAIVAGRRANNHWDQVGAALGTSKQGAQKWATENGVVATTARGPVDPRAARLATSLKASLDAGATWEEATHHRLQQAEHEFGEQEAKVLWAVALALYNEVYPETRPPEGGE